MCRFQYGGWLISRACVLGTLTLLTRSQGIPALETYLMADYCGTTLSLTDRGIPACILQLSNKTQYSPYMQCEVKIQGDYGQQLMLKFLSVDIPTCQDYLEIIDDSRNIHQEPLLTPKICDSTPTDILVTYGRTATFRFSSDRRGQGQGFKVIVTVFHTGECDQSKEICCQHDRCIDSSLRCANYDSTDGFKCGMEGIGGPVIFLILISVTVGLVLIVCFICCCVYCLKVTVCRNGPLTCCPDGCACHLSDMCQFQNDKNFESEIPRFEPGSLTTTDTDAENTDIEPTQIIFSVDQPKSTHTSSQSFNNSAPFIIRDHQNKPGPPYFASTQRILV